MQRKPLILISLLLAAFVINLDTTIVNVALPSLVRQLHTSDSQLQWVVDAFNLLFAGSVLAPHLTNDPRLVAGFRWEDRAAARRAGRARWPPVVPLKWYAYAVDIGAGNPYPALRNLRASSRCSAEAVRPRVFLLVNPYH